MKSNSQTCPLVFLLHKLSENPIGLSTCRTKYACGSGQLPPSPSSFLRLHQRFSVVFSSPEHCRRMAKTELSQSPDTGTQASGHPHRCSRLHCFRLLFIINKYPAVLRKGHIRAKHEPSNHK